MLWKGNLNYPLEIFKLQSCTQKHHDVLWTLHTPMSPSFTTTTNEDLCINDNTKGSTMFRIFFSKTLRSVLVKTTTYNCK